jgi:hypothetical protein
MKLPLFAAMLDRFSLNRVPLREHDNVFDGDAVLVALYFAVRCVARFYFPPDA